MNNVQLIGRLTADVDLRYFPGQNGDQAKASFRIAVDRPAKPDGTHDADFINCIAWGRRAEVIADHFHKGSKIAVSGRIRTGSYQNQQGATIYTFDIEVMELDFLDPKAPQQPNAADPNYQPQQQGQQYYQSSGAAVPPSQPQQYAQQYAQQPSSGAAVLPSQRRSTASAQRSNTSSSKRSAQPTPARQNAAPAPAQQEEFVNMAEVVDEGLPF